MKKALTVAVALTTAFGIAGCGGPPKATKADEGDSGAAATKQLDDSGKPTCKEGDGVTGGELRIGVTAELTGKAALSGAIAKRSLDMAAAEINSGGGILGKQVKIIYEDNQSTNPGAVNAMNKALSSDNIFTLIGPVRSTQVKAMTQTIISKKVPMLIGGTNPDLTQQGGGYLFRFRPSDALAGKAIFGYAEKQFKAKTIAIIHDSDAFGSGGAKVVEQSAKEKGVKTAKVSYTTGDKDFTAQVQQMKAAKPTVVVTYATNSEDVAVIARQMKEQGLTVPVVGSPSINSEVTFKLGGQYVQGWNVVVDFLPGSNPLNKKFSDAYKAKHGQFPDVYGGWQRDALYTIKAALEVSGCSREAFRAAMKEVEVDGVQGKLKYEEPGDMNRNLLVARIQGTGAVKVEDATELTK